MKEVHLSSQHMAESSDEVRHRGVEDVWIPTICYSCTGGPELILVRRVDGVAIDIKGNDDSPMATITQGRICLKAYYLLQKLYNPYRIKQPLKRTNPVKGPGVDPQWVEISWDEALGIVADRLKEIRGSKERLLACTYHAVQQIGMFATFCSFIDAFGPFQEFGSGASIKCGHGYHTFSNSIHGAFYPWPDYQYCNYLIVMGRTLHGSGSVMANMLHANARERGMKVIVVDPVLNSTAAKADEWLPIRPGTDLAFLLALIHVIIHELNTYDEEFLKNRTNAPYLVGPDGYWVRDNATGKVMIWDAVEQKPKTYDDPSVKDFALRGKYSVQGVECQPSFEVLREHVRQYAPEWASPIIDIPVTTIRRIAKEWVDNAKIGATIKIEGITYPCRPVACVCGRGVEAGSHAYQNIIAQHILQVLVGALEVPGGLGGGWAEPSRVDFGIRPGEDGMTLLDTKPFTWPPKKWDGGSTLFPLVTWDCEVHGADTFHFSYLTLGKGLPNFPVPPAPEVYIRVRDNPITSIGEPAVITEVIKRIPFVVDIAYIPDEVTELADVVLPDHTELEKYDLVYETDCQTTKKFRGIFMRQPVVQPVGNTKDLADICTELADRMGFLDEYNKQVNTDFGLVEPYRLEPDVKYPFRDIVDRTIRSNTGGSYGVEDFEKRNFLVTPTTPSQEYGVHLKTKDLKLRYYLPYMEKVKRVGYELGQKLAEHGIDWWPTERYTALPTYFPSIIQEVPAEYDMYAVTSRQAQALYGVGVTYPWAVEMLQHLPGEGEVLMHGQAAQTRGIRDGEEVWIESVAGRMKSKVKLCQGIRPDTILFPAQLSTNATPISRNTGWKSLTDITPLRADWTDPVTGTMQAMAMKVKVYKDKG